MAGGSKVARRSGAAGLPWMGDSRLEPRWAWSSAARYALVGCLALAGALLTALSMDSAAVLGRPAAAGRVAMGGLGGSVAMPTSAAKDNTTDTLTGGGTVRSAGYAPLRAERVGAQMPDGMSVFLPSLRRGEAVPARVAARLMAMRGDIEAWDWEGGVAMATLMASRGALALDGAEEHAAGWVDEALSEGRVRFEHPNHVIGAWAALMLDSRNPRDEYRDTVGQALEFIAEDADRVDGTLSHVPGQLWDDTLFMCAPFMADAGIAFGRPELLDAAAFEVIAHARRLQDPDTGLWYHGWSEAGDHHFADAFWARGNGWALLAAGEVLRRLPADHPRRPELWSIHRDHLLGLMRYQDSTGLWHTVLDRPDFYLETSGSAAITAGLYRAVAEAWLSRDVLLAADAGRRAVEDRVAPDGTVTGVSAGTGVAAEIEIYNRIDTDAVKPYGQGLVLMMFAAAEDASRAVR